MRHRRGDRSRRGVALLYAVISSLIAAGLATLLLGVARQSDRTVDVDTARTRARYAAEGALEVAKKELQAAIANWAAVPGEGSVDVSGVAARWWVRATGFERTVADEAGLQTIETGYELRAEASVDGATEQAYRLVNAEATPIFQYAVFYSGDLEIQPGPDMTINGRVHTNGDLHLGSNGTLTLNTNYVHAVGHVYRNRKDAPGLSQGTVNIRNWVDNPWDPSEPVQYAMMWSQSQLAALGVPSASGYDSAFTAGWDFDGNGSYLDPGDLLPFGPGALDTWSEPDGYGDGSGATLQSGEHGVGEAVVPELGSVNMFEPAEGGSWAWDAATQSYQAVPPGTGTHEPGFYHGNADLKILVDAGGTSFHAYDGAGVDITGLVSGAISLTRIYDARQANGGSGNVRLVDVNLQALAASGHFPANGLIYAAHYGAGTGTSAKGVRLTNGAVLPGKLTVVSEDPLYIQGDYNLGDATHPKQGAAVIADAVNLLSNAWDNTKTASSGLPTAAPTTYNVAILGGNMDSSVGHYNGGLENLPRFHENWSGKRCTIRGSLVNLWPSQHATAAWVYGGNRYQAPGRNWFYDTAFNSVANLPPFTPMAVSARDVVTW